MTYLIRENFRADILCAMKKLYGFEEIFLLSIRGVFGLVSALGRCNFVPKFNSRVLTHFAIH
jgi:hypothetical protein